MMNINAIDRELLNAEGKFEYTVEAGAVISPAHKYAYYDVAGTSTIFLGKDTDTAIRETGVFLIFQNEVDFWGVDVLIGGNVTAIYKFLGEDWGGQMGHVTGMFNTSQKTAFIKFEFTAFRNGLSKNVSGHFILTSSHLSSSTDAV